MQKLNRFLPLILSVCLLAPFGNDIFIPSLPEIAKVFNTDRTQLLISTFMLGLASAQIFYGPLSDRFGRKPILIVGLSIFVMASAASILVNSFTTLLIVRFLQAVGACSVMPSAMAILRDSYPHEKLLKAVSYLMGAVVIGPIIAPIFGSYLAAYFDWRGSFAFLLVLGIFYWLAVVFLFKETLAEKNHHALNFTHVFRIYGTLLTHRSYIGFLLATAFMYGALFSYVAAAPFILIHIFQIPVKDFGWYFLLFGIIIAIMSFMVPRLGKKIELHYLLIGSVVGMLISAILLLLVNIFFAPHLWLVLGPMMLAGIGMGVIRPAATTAMMKMISPKIAGTSGALLNTVVYLFGMASTAIIAFLPTTILAFASMFVILSVCATISCVFTIKVVDPINL